MMVNMNIPNIDLHCHSTISDGLFSPEELVKYAHSKDVQVLALTDHDDIDGLDRAREKASSLGMTFINGVEISVTWQKRTLHIVGLNFDHHNEALATNLTKIRKGRDARAIKIAHGLGMAGVMGALEGARSYCKDGSVGRIHFAQYLAEKGYAKDVKSVFKKFLTPGKPGYVEHVWANLTEAVAWITGAGGVAVIAHPGRYDMGNKLYPKLMNDFKLAGGEAIEVVSGSQDPSQSEYFAKLANEYGLFASCGSDFHGPGISFRQMGQKQTRPSSCRPVWDKWPVIKKLINDDKN
jgi:predicted metal-dependent phosphoesterase TrpH